MNLLDVALFHHVEGDEFAGRSQHMQLVVKRQQRLHEAVAVHRVGVLQKLEHGFAARQVQIGRDGAKLQIEVKQANPQCFVAFVDVRQFPSQVAGKTWLSRCHPQVRGREE